MIDIEMVTRPKHTMAETSCRTNPLKARPFWPKNLRRSTGNTAYTSLADGESGRSAEADEKTGRSDLRRVRRAHRHAGRASHAPRHAAHRTQHVRHRTSKHPAGRAQHVRRDQ